MTESSRKTPSTARPASFACAIALALATAAAACNEQPKPRPVGTPGTPGTQGTQPGGNTRNAADTNNANNANNANNGGNTTKQNETIPSTLDGATPPNPGTAPNPSNPPATTGTMVPPTMATTTPTAGPTAAAPAPANKEITALVATLVFANGVVCNIDKGAKVVLTSAATPVATNTAQVEASFQPLPGCGITEKGRFAKGDFSGW